MSSNGAMWRGNDFDWSAIPLNSIERVEVIRGPMSSLYGADAMGGVINIITKKQKTDSYTVLFLGNIIGQTVAMVKTNTVMALTCMVV